MRRRKEQPQGTYRVQYQGADGVWVQVRKPYRSQGTAAARAHTELDGRVAVRVLHERRDFAGRPEDVVVYHQVA
jgi:5-hydroxyisourate hydrolase-like protein (transthyretin family)